MPEALLLGIAIEYAGFPPVPDQVTALRGAGANRVLTLSPMTSEDWFYRLRDVFVEAEHAGGGVAVTALQAFGLTAHDVLGALGEVVEKGLRLVVVDASLDTAADESVLRGISAVISAVDEGGLIRTRAILDSLVPGDTKSPPKARLVDADDFARVTSA